MRRVALLAGLLVSSVAVSADPPTTGPQTEKRFPPLQLPPGFKATLFACDPLIEYPSVIAPGFRNGTLLVAIDYMTGLGTEIVRRDEIRLLEDTDGDGYADKATVWASGFNSIQGLAQHGGTVYVMHAPYLTALRDTKGEGKADERRDLHKGLGLPPEEDQIRLHNANGVVVGHDGWLYLALGDRGCNVSRPEGDKLVLEGGGILRCRPDGRDLHVFATGLRNIYDVALDEELNVFVRDNENDGGTYKVRLCHSFFGADHGYPYLYDERPDEALAPLADLGLGAPAGGVCYLEPRFPIEYRGNLLFCEWGRAVVRCPLKRAGASFTAVKETDFAAGAANDPYGFKPTDLVVDRDGALFVSDWADGQRPKRGRGRIYRIEYTGKDVDKATKPIFADGMASKKMPLLQLVTYLDDASWWTRRTAQDELEARGKDGAAALRAALAEKKLGRSGRLRSVWVLAKVEGVEAIEELFRLAATDRDPAVQAQALRAIADLTDPVLVNHKLETLSGDEAVARRIAALIAKDRCDPQGQLAGIIALGRLRWQESPSFLHKMSTKPESNIAHAAQWALRKSANWKAMLELLDVSSNDPFRSIALRAAAGQFDADLVDGLITRIERESNSARRAQYADLLTRVYKKPGPWIYWGFRPAPRPANAVAWERTERIARALDAALTKLDPADRTAVLKRMVREKVPATAGTLETILQNDRAAERVPVVLESLAQLPAEETRSILEAVLRDPKHMTTNRLSAASSLLKGLKDEKRLIATAEAVEDGAVLAELLRAIGARKTQAAADLVSRKMGSSDAEVRVSAVGALAELGMPQAKGPVEKLLDDSHPRVRAAAALAAGKLSLTSVSDRLLKLTSDSAGEVRSASLTSLRQLNERRAVPLALAALADRDTVLPALECLGTLGGPEHATAVVDAAQREPSIDMLAAAVKVLNGWATRDGLKPGERSQVLAALARLNGTSGMILTWRIGGPLTSDEARKLVDQLTSKDHGTAELTSQWRLVQSSGMEARVQLGPVKQSSDVWLAFAEVDVSQLTAVEFSTGSSGTETVWVNGKQSFRREKPAVAGPYPDRFAVDLAKGTNRVLVQLADAKGAAEFQLRFRRKSAAPQLERLAAAALSRAGNPTRGREILLNAEKSLCVKCHRVDDKGERFGPELTGLGSRFSKAYIIESILEPNRTVSPSYETIVVDLKNQRTVSGIKVEENNASLVLVDAEAKRHVVMKDDIDSRRKSVLSTMPEGLEKRLTEDEFVDLISYLVSLKAQRSR